MSNIIQRSGWRGLFGGASLGALNKFILNIVLFCEEDISSHSDYSPSTFFTCSDDEVGSKIYGHRQYKQLLGRGFGWRHEAAEGAARGGGGSGAHEPAGLPPRGVHESGEKQESCSADHQERWWLQNVYQRNGVKYGSSYNSNHHSNICVRPFEVVEVL
jgi:hypothetical protein